MADDIRDGYDTSIGTKERSAVAATKIWASVFAVIALIGIIMAFVFLSWTGRGSIGPVSTDNTATRPAEP